MTQLVPINRAAECDKMEKPKHRCNRASNRPDTRSSKKITQCSFIFKQVKTLKKKKNTLWVKEPQRYSWGYSYSCENHRDNSSGDWRNPAGGCTWTASGDLDPWGREGDVRDMVHVFRSWSVFWPSTNSVLGRCTWQCADTSFLWETLEVPPRCRPVLQSPNTHPGRHRGVQTDWSGAGVLVVVPAVHFWTRWPRSPRPKKGKDEPVRAWNMKM